ncbi:hypothetical protein HKI87_07g50690 [Chloropicon roscoffensis]|uniref:Uncharacterized protein n=1 Tax=Chloropicon roscoffensis TaxID=1461544 RepID=A0AAX4PB13_9CHLO
MYALLPRHAAVPTTLHDRQSSFFIARSVPGICMNASCGSDEEIRIPDTSVRGDAYREGLLAAIPLQGKGQVRVSRSPRTAARGRGGPEGDLRPLSLAFGLLVGQGLLPPSLLFFGQGFVLVLVSEDAVRHDRRPNEHYAYPVRRPKYPV